MTGSAQRAGNLADIDNRVQRYNIDKIKRFAHVCRCLFNHPVGDAFHLF